VHQIGDIPQVTVPNSTGTNASKLRKVEKAWSALGEGEEKKTKEDHQNKLNQPIFSLGLRSLSGLGGPKILFFEIG
jgi:hypothetical protein